MIREPLTGEIRLPILSRLIPEGLGWGKFILVEFDPDSKAYEVLLTMAAGALENYPIDVFTYSRDPRELRSDIGRLGVPENLEREGRLRICDWYTITTGRPSTEQYALNSLKVSDLRIDHLDPKRSTTIGTGGRSRIAFHENVSVLLRFNDEKSMLEYYASRGVPNVRLYERLSLDWLATGIHSASFYKALENTVDGVIDVKLREKGDGLVNVIRVRNLKGLAHDTRWLELKTEGPLKIAPIS